MALDAGSVFVRLAGLFQQDDFDRYDRAVDSARATARDPIEQKLGADTTQLDRDLTSAKGKVSLWARTQDKISLGVDKGKLDSSLTDARSRISAWGDVENRFKLAYLKRSLDETLTEARARINTWGDVENKFRLGYSKGELAASLAEARAEIKAWAESPVKMRLEVDAGAAGAEIAALRAAADAGGGGLPGGGGGGGGGGISNFLFGGGGRGRGRFGLGTLNPFRYGGIHGPLGAVGGAVGLGPEHLVGAGLAVGGSAFGAAAGAGVTALGALGQFAVGGGSDLAVIKTTISDTQTLSKSYDALDKAVARYGAGSRQARQAQAALNAQIAQLGGGVGTRAEVQLAKLTSALNNQWRSATQQARANAVAVLEQVVHLGSDYVPKVAHAAQMNLAIINTSLRPLFSWLEGPHGMKIFDDLENRFRANIRPAIEAFTNAVEYLLKVMDDASKYTGGLTQSLDRLFVRLNNQSPAELSAKIAKLHNDFIIWETLIKYVAKDLSALFHGGANEGNDLIIKLDDLLIRWNKWETSASGSTAIHTFFVNRKNELLAVLTVVGQVAKMFGEVWVALQPLVPAVTLFARSVSSALGATLVPLVSALASGLNTVLKAFLSLGNRNGPLGSMSVLFRDAIIAPLGVALISLKLFGKEATKNLFNISGHLSTIRSKAKEAFGVVRTLFREGPGAAWQGLKDLFSGKAKISGTEQMELAANKMQGAADTMAGAADKMGKAAGEQNTAGDKQESAGNKQEAAGNKQDAAGTKQEAAGDKQEAAGTKQQAAGAEEVTAGTEQEAAGAEELGAGGAAGAAGAAGGLRAGAAGVAGAAVPAAGLAALGAYGAYRLFTSGSGVSQRQFGTGLSALLGPRSEQLGSGALSVPSGFHTSRNVGDLFSSLTGGSQKIVANMPDDIKKLNDQLKNLNTFSGLSAQKAEKLREELQKIRKEPDITEFQRRGISKLLGLLDKQVIFPKHLEFSMPFSSALKKVTSDINNFFRDTGRGIKSLKDDFNSNMREIASTVGLYSDKGHKLMHENVQKMVGALTKGMEDGKISVKDGMAAINSTLHEGEKTGATRWDTAWKDMFQTVRDLYHHHKIDTETYLADIHNLLDQGMKHDSKNWKSEWRDMFTSVIQMYGKHKIDTKTFMDNIHSITIDAATKIKQDTTKQYQQMFSNLKNQYQSGQITQQQFNQKKHQLEQESNKTSANAMAAYASNVLGTMSSTAGTTYSGVYSVWKELDSLLKPLGAAKIPAPTKVGVAAAKFTAGNISASQYVNTVNPGTGLGLHARGGSLPGAEFGLEDQMTLVDPMGRPRARMAGDESIYTRWQRPYVDMGLQLLGFERGSEDLWSQIDRPHGYSKGGGLKKYATGGPGPVPTAGPGTGGYVYPFVSGTVLGRTDQGIDASMPVGSPIGPIGDAVMGPSAPNWYHGQPIITWTLLNGPDAGRRVYLAEQIVPAASPGQHVSAHQAVARFASSGTGIEMGWAGPGTETLAQATTGYTEGQVTPAGASFKNFILGLAHGRIVGGGVGTFGGPIWQNITAPRVSGHGTMTEMAQKAIDRATSAANAYGQKQVSRMGGLGTVPGNVSGPVAFQMAHAGRALGLNKTAIAGMIGNAYQESLLNPNLNVGAGRGLFSWDPSGNPVSAAKVVLGNVAQQVALALSETPGGVAAFNRASSSPSAAAQWFEMNFEHAGTPNMPNRIAAANAAFARGLQRGGHLDFVNKANVPLRDIHGFQRAAEKQGGQIRSKWNTSPVSWGPGGWPFVLLPPNDPKLHGRKGYHTVEGGKPTAYVGKWSNPHWTIVASHELAEMLVDPFLNRSSGGYREEVSDPVKGYTYFIDGVPMADWVTPAWYGGAQGPYDWTGRLLGPKTLSAKGYDTTSGTADRFQRGGSLRHSTRSSRPRIHPTLRPKRATSILKYLTDVPPGMQKWADLVNSFVTDDRAIAKIDTKYTQDQQLFNLYDSGSGGTLPQQDLQVLVGLQEKEWNTYWNEYRRLPHAIDQLTKEAKTLIGHPAGRVRVKEFTTPYHGPGAPHRYRTVYRAGTGVDASLQQLNADQNTVSLIQNEIKSADQAAKVHRHAISAKARAAAHSYASQLNTLADALVADQKNSKSVTYEIAKLTDQLAGAWGSRYAHIQDEIQKLQAHRFSGSKSSSIYAQLTQTRQRADLAAQHYSNEGFQQAWADELKKYKLEKKLSDIQSNIKDLQTLLKAEQKKLAYIIGSNTGAVTGGGKKGLNPVYPNTQDPTGGILQSLEYRYQGAPDGSVEPITDSMETIGYNILDLIQQGAKVEKPVTDQITKLFKDLGLTLPVGFGAGGVATSSTNLQAQQDFQNFQSALANIFGSYGSNFVPTGVNPFGTAAGLDAGTRYYGAAAGGASGATAPPSLGSPSGGGDTTINIEQNFASGPPAPVTYAAGLRYELGAQI